jgi:peroxiredoxin Q/BCP
VLKVGARAPLFSTTSATGQPVSLEALRGRIVVLYFFRKAFTRNCTVETRGFRDNYDELRALGAQVIGVSPDESATQCEFATELGVKFPMIADRDRTLSHAYDVFFTFLPFVHRVTYIIDGAGEIAGVLNHEFQVVRHLDQVMQLTRQIAARASAGAR